MYVPDLTAPPSRTFGVVDTNAMGAWDTRLQTFRPIPTRFETLDTAQATALWEQTLTNLIDRLDARPCVRAVGTNGQTTEQPPRRICCPACGSENLHMPIVLSGTDLVDTTKHGKGQVHCPDCNTTGTKAAGKGYTMYTYGALIRERHDFLQTLRGYKDTLDDLLADTNTSLVSNP